MYFKMMGLFFGLVILNCLLFINLKKLSNFIKYNDEYCYGWAVSCKGELIGSDEVCLHKPTYTSGIEIYKDEPEIILE